MLDNEYELVAEISENISLYVRKPGVIYGIAGQSHLDKFTDFTTDDYHETLTHRVAVWRKQPFWNNIFFYSELIIKRLEMHRKEDILVCWWPYILKEGEIVKIVPYDGEMTDIEPCRELVGIGGDGYGVAGPRYLIMPVTNPEEIEDEEVRVKLVQASKEVMESEDVKNRDPV